MTTIKIKDPDNPGQWIRVAGGSFFWRGTKAEYDALPTKDPALLYVIEDASGSAWMTEGAADAKYVNVNGDTMTGALSVVAPTAPAHAVTKGYVDGRLRFGQVDLPAWGNAEAHSSVVCRITHNYGTTPALIVPVLVSPYAVDSYPEYRYFTDADSADTDMVSMQAGFSGPNYFNVHLHMGPRAQNVTAVFKIAWFALMP